MAARKPVVTHDPRHGGASIGGTTCGSGCSEIQRCGRATCTVTRLPFRTATGVHDVTRAARSAVGFHEQPSRASQLRGFQLFEVTAFEAGWA